MSLIVSELVSSQRHVTPKRVPSWGRHTRAALGGLLLLAIACGRNQAKPTKPKGHQPRSRAATSAPSNSAPEQTAIAPKRFVPRSETLTEIAKVRNAKWRVFPQSSPPHRLSFFARNVGALVGQSVWTFPVEPSPRNPCHDHRFDEFEPREVATLADQRLLLIGAKKTIVIDSNCESTLELPKVSYTPSSRLVPEPRWPNRFSLFDSRGGVFYRFEWQQPESLGSHGIWLPSSTLEAEGLRDTLCSVMLDGSLACVRGNELVVGWPGQLPKRLGEIGPGAPPVRVLPGARTDHVRLVRDDLTCEEYWLVPRLPKTRGFTLPTVPFDIAASLTALAILQVEQDDSGQADVRLVILEQDGSLRWTRSLEKVPNSLSEQEWLDDYFRCRSVALHAYRPWVAVSNCRKVDVFDTNTGQRLRETHLAPP